MEIGIRSERPTSGEKVPPNKIRILVGESSRFIGSVIGKNLKGDPRVTFRIATTRQELEKILREALNEKDPYDIVLLARNFDREKGLELAGVIRDEYLANSTVLLTAGSEQHLPEELEAMHVDATIGKNELVQKLRRLVTEYRKAHP